MNGRCPCACRGWYSRWRQVRELGGSEKAPELLQELFVEGTTQLIDCLPGVWDNTLK